MSPLCIVILSQDGLHVRCTETPRMGTRYQTPYRPELWGLARAYTVGSPGGHPWAHWTGALAILATVAFVLGRAL